VIILEMDSEDDRGSHSRWRANNNFEEDLDEISFEEEDEEDAGVEVDDEDVLNNSKASRSQHHKYQVLSTTEVALEMDVSIREVCSVIQLPVTTTRMLLTHFQWNQERLLERYYDQGEAELFKEAGIIPPMSSTESKDTRKVCDVCCLELKLSLMTDLGCGHAFCNNCWAHFLETKIKDDGEGINITCMEYKCSVVVDDATVMSLLQKEEVKKRYQQLITSSFVTCNRNFKYCPNPLGCDYVIKAEETMCQIIVCRCGHAFCFKCVQPWHEPVKCDLLRLWKKKCDDDSETSNWIAANTKECPKCKVTIEKDGGCNHMVCKNVNCKYDFCWVCLGSWEPHGSSWYSCNRFDEVGAKKARDAQEKSRADLQRYLFYCNRYMNHMNSLKLENKLYASIKEKMEEMQQHNMSWIEVQFLKKAVDVLCQCRQALMYTYVFAFYLNKNNQSMIFEDNQRDLECATEKLSEYLERDITGDNISDIKQRVQDKYRSVLFPSLFFLITFLKQIL